MSRKGEPSSLSVLVRMPVFRRLWSAVAISSLGDWLGLLATTALAAYLTRDTSNLFQGAAISGVLVTRLLPDLLLAPVAGAFVDRFDRRKVAIIGDVAAGLLYLSIALVGSLSWLLVAQFLAEAVGLFSTPAKQAIWVNIVPRERLAVANQLNYVSIYGMVPVAALLFALLSTTAQFFGAPVTAPAGAGTLISGPTSPIAINIALVVDAATYVFSASMIFVSRAMIPAFVGEPNRTASVFSLVAEGVRYIKNSRLMRAIYVGIIGAFGAGGLVAGVAQTWVGALGAGNAGYSILFGSVFTGLAMGMLIGPKVFPSVPRRMIFSSAIGVAGVTLVVMAMLQDFVGAAVASVVMGVFAGTAWINGFTLIGQEVSDQLRGRVFAFVMSSVRLTLLATIAVGPVLAGAIGSHRVSIGSFDWLMSGPALVLAAGGLIAVGVSLFAGHQVGGFTRGAWRRLLGRPERTLLGEDGEHGGTFIVVEGADPGRVAAVTEAVIRHVGAEHGGAGQVVAERVGAGGSAATPRRPPAAEASLADAFRAVADLSDQVQTVVRPALDGGSVVVRDGFVDEFVVRFAAVDGLGVDRLQRMARWATGELRPDLTVLVDDAAPADQRGDDDSDPAVRYRERAELAPERYLTVRPQPDGSVDLTVEARERIDSTLRVRAAAGSRTASVSAVPVTVAGPGTADPIVGEGAR